MSWKLLTNRELVSPLKLPPLYNGRIISRYKRFLADVQLDSGKQVTAHCANTGAMTGCWKPGASVQLSLSNNPKRKLKWTLERVDMGGGWIGVNTNRVNKIVSSFIVEKSIEALTDYEQIKSEPSFTAPGYKSSRFDFLLTSGNRADCFVEIKNTTMLRNNKVLFPDAVTTRGKKHLELLQHAVNQGFRAVMIYAVSRPEGLKFGIASDIDPNYHQELIKAQQGGVELIALRLKHTDDGVEMGACVEISLEKADLGH